MIARLATGTAPEEHIRPFNPGRDLGDLADLIEEAFGPELAATGSRMVEDMRTLALWGPALHLMAGLLPLFSGFVWIEDDRLVGNVSLSQDELPGTWMLSNVAVQSEYRGRGIASRLVERAIAQVRAVGGRRICLQVRTDNEIAHALYRHRGFITYDTYHEMQLSHSHWESPVDDTKITVRPVRPRDGVNLYRVVVASTPTSALPVLCIRRQQYCRGLWWHLAQVGRVAFLGQQDIELVGEQQGQMVAYGHIRAHLFHGPHELSLYVLPSARGPWEAAFVDTLLRLVPRTPGWHVRADISASHPQAVRALQHLGFETLRVLDQMYLDL